MDSTTHPPPSPFKSRGGPGRLLRAARCSWAGLRAAVRHEAAFRQELAVGLPLLLAAPWLGRDAAEVLLLVGSLLLVWITELLNSAIEAVADAVSTAEHPLLGRAKDLGSAAVMLALVGAALCWATVAVLRFSAAA